MIDKANCRQWRRVYVAAMMGKALIVVLVLSFCQCFKEASSVQNCVNGLSAERVRQLGRVAGNRKADRNNQQRIIPDITFTCSGTVTKWIVAAEWKGGGGDINFPEMQIWREMASDGVYTKIHGTPLNISTENNTAIYEYTIPDPVEFQEGDVLGVFEPDHSRLELYYTDKYGPINYCRSTGDAVTAPGDDMIDLSGAVEASKSKNEDEIEYVYDMPLVHVEITPTDDTLASDCISSFATMEAVEIGLQQDGGDKPIKDEQREQRLIPGISFTCHGFITKWILAAKWESGDDRVNLPELQTWNLTDGATYTKQGATTFNVTEGSGEMTYFEYSPNPPHEFNDGDVLGMFIPEKTRFKVFFASLDSAPVNYVTDTGASISAPQGDYTTNGQDMVNAFPLIAAEVSIPSSGAPSDTPSPSLPLPVPSTDPNPSPEPKDSGSSSSSDNSGLAAGVVIAVLAALTLGGIVGVLLAVILVRRKRKGYDTRNSDGPGLTNPVYDGAEPKSGKFQDSVVKEPLYQAPEGGAAVYEGVEASQYLEPVSSGRYTQCIVPTEGQRREFGESLEIYASVSMTSYASEESYFPESEIYWAPASNQNELYAQLARNKFREIPRPLVRVAGHIGTGNFGQVNKGVWQSPEGNRDVAVKTLKLNSSEIEKVKFLQEAAIMGQFHHPNVVTLHGVVTVVEPVMIVLELIPNGDLRQYLLKLQPIPGEMLPSNTSQMCLDFCCQIASGMDYLSKKAFVHRDLAARNILVADNKTCKISDFGMARDLEEEDYYVSRGGQIPVKWTAPEAINFKKYSTASDVWSYGAVMYEIWSLGHKPFEGYTNMQAMTMVNSQWRLPPPAGCPRAVYKLMIHCWHPEAGSRPLFSDLLQSLSRPETELLSWTEEDTKTHPQPAVLGGPLDAGNGLYPDLQAAYSTN